jgi:NADPH:quinone reductase-like Zn-dependent oxidoreductase
MKAVFFNKLAGPEELIFGEIPQPKPARGEVLVRVHATAVMPTEPNWEPTFKTPEGNPRPFPVVLSHEFSGVVAELGAGVTGFKIGDAVYGMNDWYANGAQAEYCIAPATALAPKPRSLDHTKAGVVPISALTAWQALFDHGGLQAGQRVLIHAGAGAVGSFALQLAHSRGAHVTTTVSKTNLEFARDLGADEVIDYQANRFEDVAHDMDLVFDTVGQDTLMRSWKVLRPGGKVVTIVSAGTESLDERSRKAFFIVEPNAKQLIEIGNLVDSGKLKVLVEAVFPLAQTREAFAHASRGGTRGKVALQVTGCD